MTVNEILTPVILQEFKKYENLGHQISRVVQKRLTDEQNLPFVLR